jgi:hypothetical protein
MPSTSKAQQRLMGVAYAVKSGDMQLSDVDTAYRKEVEELVDNMTLKQLKDFASTKHDGLPERVKEDLALVTPPMLGGMGDVVLPDAGALGSGDAPTGIGDPDKVYKKKKKKVKLIMSMEEFIAEQRAQIEPFKPEQPKEENEGEGEYKKSAVPLPDKEFVARQNMQRQAKSVVGGNYE